MTPPTESSPERARPSITAELPGPGDGFVPHPGVEPGGRYEAVSRAEAVERIAAAGFDRDDAELVVEEYLRDTSYRYGDPPGREWVIDQYDLAEIARGYDWVDHHQGETITAARDRAGEYAAAYARQVGSVDRTREPGRAGRAEREAARWEGRAQPTGTHTARTAGGRVSDEERRQQLTRWHTDDQTAASDAAAGDGYSERGREA